MKKSNYYLVKKLKYKKYNSLIVRDAFKLKNKKEFNGVVNFYNDIIINKIIKKTMDKHFKKILDFIIKCEEDDDPDGLMLCLNETDKLKKEINNKLNKILDKKQKEFNLKKIEVIENDLKKKLMTYQISKMQKAYIERMKRMNDFDDEEYEEERHRSR